MRYKGKGGIQYDLEAKPFAQGGEGQVFNIVGKPNLVAKLYKDTISIGDRERKLNVMVTYPPDKSVLNQIAWPVDVLYNGNTFIGFVMPKLKINEDLNVIYEYGSSAKYPNIPWSNKIIIAKNLCAVLNAVHEAGHACGDLNPKNISVDPNTGHIVFVDTDSYHIQDGGNTYRCCVGIPEYLPVEIQRKMKGGLSTTALPTFSKNTDNFALAVHIFQLLMNGVHPFSCAVLPSQVSVAFPQPSDNIIKGQFPFMQKVQGITIPKFAPPINILPVEIQDLFKRAFIDGHTNPDKRPSPVEWFTALSKLEKTLKTCSKVSHHEYYNSLSSCPWCDANNKFNQGIQVAATTPLAQSTIKQSMKLAYVPAPNYKSTNSTGTSISAKTSTAMHTHNKVGDMSIRNFIPFAYLFLAVASMALIFVMVEWAVLVLGIIELIVFFILFNPNSKLGGYKDEYSIVQIIVIMLLGIALLILFDVYLEYIVPKLHTIRVQANQGTASTSYYVSAVKDVKIFCTVAIVLLIIESIVGCILGKGSIASIISPLAVLISISIWFMIINAFIELPSSSTEIYEVSTIIGSIFYGILITIPSLLIAAILWFVGIKVGEI